MDEASELDLYAARGESDNGQITHNVAERDQERGAHELLALARRHISSRRFANALEAVKKAQSRFQLTGKWPSELPYGSVLVYVIFLGVLFPPHDFFPLCAGRASFL